MSKQQKWFFLWVMGAIWMSWAVAAAAVESSSPDQLLKQAQETLNETEWSIELIPSSAGKAKPMKDTLRFEEGKVTSEKSSSEGFPTSNFTLSIADGGTPIWETMQTGKEGTLIFWRGEIHDDTMRGLYSKPSNKEGVPPQDFSFSGKQTKKLKPAATKPRVIEEAPPKPAPTPEPPSKKKGY